jgi:hypothetical protein
MPIMTLRLRAREQRQHLDLSDSVQSSCESLDDLFYSRPPVVDDLNASSVIKIVRLEIVCESLYSFIKSFTSSRSLARSATSSLAQLLQPSPE